MILDVHKDQSQTLEIPVLQRKMNVFPVFTVTIKAMNVFGTFSVVTEKHLTLN